MKNGVKLQTANRVVGFLSHPRRALVAAGILHLFVAVIIFGVGRFGIFKQQFDQHGIGLFALDSYTYRTQADELSKTLLHDGIITWLKAPEQLHVKLYSVCFALFRPLVGANILAAEPLNLFYYLAILALTFSLAQKLAGQRAALLASAIVALWPSLLLHTTQLLRDSLFMMAMLALLLVLTNLLTQVYDWASGIAAGTIGAISSLVLWITRTEWWLVIRSIIFLAFVLFAIRMFRERKLLAWNLLGLALLLSATFLISARQDTQAGNPVLAAPLEFPQWAGNNLWARIALRRHGFILEGEGQSGSIVDADVEFSSEADVLRYVPRAAEVGYLAPFPKMWFTPGYNVGLIGRLLAAGETLVLYVVEVLALIGLWQNRQRLSAWLLALSVTIGVTALGLVVANIGTLYRMRYAFDSLLVILAATVVGRWIKSNNSRPAKPEEAHSI